MIILPFWRKNIGIKKCAICSKKFVAKRKTNTCCSNECKEKKKKQNAEKFYQKNKQKINEKYADYRKKYVKNHKEKIKDYQKQYREKRKWENKNEKI